MASLISLLFFAHRLLWGGVHTDPILQEAWRQMLGTGQPVDVYVATPPAMLLHSYRDPILPPCPTPWISTPKEVSAWYDGLGMKDGGGKLYMHTTRDVFLFGDALAATSAVQLISRSGAVPKLMPEGNLEAFALRDRNVILIGSPNYSPLAARFLAKVPYSVRYNPTTREEIVSDLGGQHVFRPISDETGMMTKAYGIITVLPSETGGDKATQIVLFSGITSAGPQAALEFFGSSGALRALKQKFIHEGINGFPRAYQVIVRCSMDHNLALTWEYAAHQVIRYSPLLQ